MAEEYAPLLETPESSIVVGSAGDTRRRRRRRFRSVRMYIWQAVFYTYTICFMQACHDSKNVASFSVELHAFGGINATSPGRVVSPWFVLTAKVENPRAWLAWCSAGADVVVSYDGVSLAWGRVPAFCVPRKGTVELTAATAGKGVVLSDHLRRSLAADWNTGRAQVVAEMKLFYDANGWPGLYGYSGVSLVSRQLALANSTSTSGPAPGGATYMHASMTN